MRLCDLHCDTATELLVRRVPLKKNELHIDLDRLCAYEQPLQVFAAWTPPALSGAARFENAMAVIDNLKREIGINTDSITLCRTFPEIETAWANNRAAALLSVEGAGAFDGRLENIDKLYNAGVRIVTITWNGENELAVGQPDAGGLTAFGIAALSRMSALGIIADISHANAESAGDILDNFTGAVMASHSDAFEICPHLRNLTPALRARITARGGLIGMNLYPPFVGVASADGILSHIAAVIDGGGEDSLALGCDFDGVDALPDGIAGVQDMKKLYASVASRFGDKTAERLFYLNAVRFFQNSLR